MNSYFAYGIGIHSDIPLPDLPAAEIQGPADVLMNNGKVEPLEPIALGTQFCIQFGNDEAYFFYDKLGSCRVSQGRTIVGMPCEGIDETDLGFLVQGPGISVLLHQRGT